MGFGLVNLERLRLAKPTETAATQGLAGLAAKECHSYPGNADWAEPGKRSDMKQTFVFFRMMSGLDKSV